MSRIIFFSSYIIARPIFKFCNTRVRLGLPRAFSVGGKLDPLRPEIRFPLSNFEDKDGVEDVEE